MAKNPVRDLSFFGLLLLLSSVSVEGYTSAPVNDIWYSKLWGLHVDAESVEISIDPSIYHPPGMSIIAHSSASAHMDDIWRKGHRDCSSAPVAVLDTGIDLSHPDLADNIWTNVGEAPTPDGIDNDGNGFIDDIHGWNAADYSSGTNGNGIVWDEMFHGTHTAGTIGARGNNRMGVTGACPIAKIIPIRMMDGNGFATNLFLLRAFDYLVKISTSTTADLTSTVPISNHSYGISMSFAEFDQLLGPSIEALRQAGHIMVVAAGNNTMNLSNLPPNMQPLYPAMYPNEAILAVAAITSTGDLANFSNWGNSIVELGAPGDFILSTMPTYTTFAMWNFFTSTWKFRPGWEFLSGTSMAAPHVAGALALAKSAFPTVSTPALKNLLQLAVAGNNPALATKTISGGHLDMRAFFAAIASSIGTGNQ